MLDKDVEHYGTYAAIIATMFAVQWVCTVAHADELAMTIFSLD